MAFQSGETLEADSSEIRRIVDVDADARIGETPMPVHLRDGHVRIPVRDAVVAGVDLAVHVTQPEGRGNDD